MTCSYSQNDHWTTRSIIRPGLYHQISILYVSVSIDAYSQTFNVLHSKHLENLPIQSVSHYTTHSVTDVHDLCPMISFVLQAPQRRERVPSLMAVIARETYYLSSSPWQGVLCTKVVSLLSQVCINIVYIYTFSTRQCKCFHNLVYSICFTSSISVNLRGSLRLVKYAVTCGIFMRSFNFSSN